MTSKIIALALVLSVCTVGFAVASDALTSGDYIYTLDDEENVISISGYIGNDPMLYIPGDIDGNTVGHIAPRAFCGNTIIKGVSLPSTISSIGSEAFYGCSMLSEMYIPKTVTSIGLNAFSACDKLIANFEQDSYAYMYFVANDLQYQYFTLDEVTASPEESNTKEYIELTQSPETQEAVQSEYIPDPQLETPTYDEQANTEYIYNTEEPTNVEYTANP